MPVCVSLQLPLIQHDEHSLLVLRSGMRHMLMRSYILLWSSYAPRQTVLVA